MADPVDVDAVYEIVDISNVYRSYDRGKSWNSIWNNFRYSSIDAMAIAPSDPDIIYTVKNGFGIFKSENGGNDWRFLHQSGIDYTYSLAVHPHNADIIYSGYNPKPFQDWAMVRRSLDGGDSWETVLEIPHSKGITSVAIDTNNPDIIYAAVKALHEGFDIYKNMHRAMPAWNIKGAVRDPSPVPYHDGAIRYFKEVGVWSPEKDKWQAQQLKSFEERAAKFKQ